MANAIYDPGREGFLNGQIRWDGVAVMKSALARGVTFSAAHKFVSDAAGTLVATSAAMTAQTPTNGVADANDVTWLAVPAGAAIPAILIFQASAVTGGADVAPAAQRLVLYVDAYTGLPVTPNGGDISVAWDNGVNKIFKL